MSNLTKQQKNKIVWGIVIATGIIIFRKEIYQFLFMMGDRDRVVSILEEYGAAGPVLLGLFLFLQVFLAWIPGHVLMIAGGFLYGFKTGFIITAVTTIIGSQLAFLLARRAGKPLVDRFVPENLFQKWDRAAEKQGALFFLMTFWLPIFPSDMMCFIAGLGKIKSRKFFAANFLGRLPCAALLVVVGSDGYRMPVEFWFAAAGLIAAIMIGWRYLERWMVNRPASPVLSMFL